MATNQLPVHNIILAEDDEDDKYIFADALREINPGIKVEYVSDGNQLMALLENFLPDLLFLDLDMPHKNGLQCLVEIRGNEKLEHLPTVVFSSTTRPANIQTAYEMGAHLFLIKSSNFNDYKAALQSIMRLPWKTPEVIRKQYCINGRYTAFS